MTERERCQVCDGTGWVVWVSTEQHTHVPRPAKDSGADKGAWSVCPNCLGEGVL